MGGFLFFKQHNLDDYRFMIKLKLQAAMKGPSQSTRIAACRCRGVPRRCIQGKTLYMFEQFGVDSKLFVELVMS